MTTPEVPTPTPAGARPILLAWVRRHKIWTGLGVLLIIGAIGNAVGAQQRRDALRSTLNQLTPTPATTSRAGTPDPTPTRESSIPPTGAQGTDQFHLRQFGALKTTWDAEHAVDPRVPAGNAYDADPELSTDVRYDQRYYMVSVPAERIASYDERFAKGTSLRVAQYEVITSELPPDAKLVWRANHGTCMQVQYSSSIIRRALGVPDAGVLVSYYSPSTADGSDSPFRPSSIAEVYLSTAYYDTPSGGAFC